MVTRHKQTCVQSERLMVDKWRKTHFVPIKSDKNVTYTKKTILTISKLRTLLQWTSQTLRTKNYTSFGVFLSFFVLFFFLFFKLNNVHPNNINTHHKPTSDRGQMNMCFEISGLQGGKIQISIKFTVRCLTYRSVNGHRGTTSETNKKKKNHRSTNPSPTREVKSWHL